MTPTSGKTQGVGLAVSALRGAVCFGAVGVVYAASESVVHSVCGLGLPASLWATLMGIHAAIGFAAGAFAGVLAEVAARRSWIAPAGRAVRLLSVALGVLVLAGLGLPLNDAVLGPLLSASSLLGNAALVGAAVLATVVFVRVLGDRRGRLRPVVAGGAIAVVALLVAAVQHDASSLRAAFAAGRPHPPASRAVRPNVLWIVMDTTRADRLSVYGYDRDTTPNLAALARDGVVFERAYAESSWTKPTHFAMVTSRVASGLRRRLPPEYETAAEILGAAGYETGAMLGNVVLGSGSGFAQGFDWTWSGPVKLLLLRLIGKTPLVEWILETELLPPATVLRHLHEKTFLLATAARADDLTDRAVSWLRERGDRPFFLFVNYMDPHDPYDPPSPFRERFADGVDPLAGFFKYRPGRGFMSGNRFVRDVAPHMDEEDWGDLRRLYDAEIAFVDHEIGRLVRVFEEHDAAGGSIVIVTSDHGELFGEHGLGNHYKALTEEETRVPLLLRASGVPAGRVRSVAQPHDLLPTVLALAGIDAPPDVDGRDLLAEGRAGRPAPDAAFGLLVRPPDAAYPHTAPGHLLSARTENWQLVWSSTEGHRLYDLRTDPSSTRDVFRDHPDANAAARRLAAWRQATGVDLDAAEDDSDPVLEERLRALGYAE